MRTRGDRKHVSKWDNMPNLEEEIQQNIEAYKNQDFDSITLPRRVLKNHLPKKKWPLA